MNQSDNFTKGSYDLSANSMNITYPQDCNTMTYINTNSTFKSNTNFNKQENPKSILKKVYYDESQADNNEEQQNYKSENQTDSKPNLTKKTSCKNVSSRVNSNIKGKAQSNSKVVESKRKVPIKK